MLYEALDKVEIDMHSAKHFRAVGELLPRRAKVPAIALHGDLPV